ncbi:MAG: Dicer-like protein 2 [Sclerophora amabilis]|nr:MAG: Dicer-like protein 2 [Sclerophora amabilis]
MDEDHMDEFEGESGSSGDGDGDGDDGDDDHREAEVVDIAEATESVMGLGAGDGRPPRDDEDPRSGSRDPDISDERVQLRPRPYQVEMKNKSMQKNIIVALVWFLAPTVALCEQQSKVITRQLPAYPLRFFSGADNVDRWSEQSLWDAALLNVRIVVSTYQILLDALTHGFVPMSRLALLVYDEAHNCVSKHPANVIMQNFYHPFLAHAPEMLPHILGLTASPIMSSKRESLQTIEQNLNAITKTPKLHREEMLRFVHRPLLEKLLYPESLGDSSPGRSCPMLQRLFAVYTGLDIMEDPYIIELKKKTDVSSSNRLRKAILQGKTYCQEQVKNLLLKSSHVFQELGKWAAAYYIATTIAKLRASFQAEDERLGDFNAEEKIYLLKVLGRVHGNAPFVSPTSFTPFDVSPKLERLIDFLVAEQSSDFAGLVFVQQRAEVAVLVHLLSIHPRTKDFFRCGSFVGTSASSNRKATSVTELLDPRDQVLTLDELRSGEKNLIITTSVLEEGIDVSACHMVICFQKPPNLKSFIQRRGRARKKHSKYIIMVGEEEGLASGDDWEELEEEMKRMYQDDMRTVEAIREREDIDEDGNRSFRVERTQALLTLDNASQHLYHFCSKLPSDSYVDTRPEFVILENKSTGRVSAKIILPSSVEPSVRRTSGTAEWETERMAKKDAAYESYLSLYRAGLVNDHLLPLSSQKESAEELFGLVEKRPSLVTVPVQVNPLVEVAKSWHESKWVGQSTVVTIKGHGPEPVQLEVLLPVRPPPIPRTTLFWNEVDRLEVFTETLDTGSMNNKLSADVGKDHQSFSRVTSMLLDSVLSTRRGPSQNDFVVCFKPFSSRSQRHRSPLVLEGATPAQDVYDARPSTGLEMGLVRDVLNGGRRHVFRRWVMRQPEQHSDHMLEDVERSEVLCIECSRLPKRVDFLHALTSSVKTSHTKGGAICYLAPQNCTIDSLPFRYSQAALFIPSIIHLYEKLLVADRLRNTILSSAHINDLNLVVTAISAPAAQEGTNYEQLEFLGDAILKFCASLQLLARYPKWHEGYLSARKDRLVSNSRLARAALKTGLDRFTLTKPFTGLKWRPPYVSDLLEPREDAQRKVSTKTLADVVEALIGAAYLDGGYAKAIACLSIFLPEPEIDWPSLDLRCSSLYDTIVPQVAFPPQFGELERLIGHTFSKKSLLVEAMTHSSWNHDYSSPSYQRLEFLGDSVLDSLVVRAVFKDKDDHADESKFPSHAQMYWIRAVLVNANFLGFLCMEQHILQRRVDVRQVSSPECQTASPNTRRATINRDPSFEEIDSSTPLHLWQFMRHSNSDITQAQSACRRRHGELREAIIHALWHDDKYPWALLARLDADKFFSDLVESVLGAVYVDSHGDWATCEAFAERLGILRYLKRIIAVAPPCLGKQHQQHQQQQRQQQQQPPADAHGRHKMNLPVQLQHPKGRLAELSGSRKITYVLGVDGHGNSAINGGGDQARPGRAPAKRFSCRVLIGDEAGAGPGPGDEAGAGKGEGMGEGDEAAERKGEGGSQRELAMVGDGTSKEEVQTRAAEEALRVLDVDAERP